MDKDMAEIYANIYHYKCHECKTDGLSRDDVHSVKTGNGVEHFICDMCWESIPLMQKDD